MTIPWTATLLTLMPQMFPGPLGESLAGRALQDGLWALDCVDIRDHATDRHRSVDDTPAGGGPGMVLRADIVARAIDAADAAGRVGRPLIYLSPRGAPLTQRRAHELAQGQGVALLCGRFEGVDERVLQEYDIEELSIGDYVLSGGDLAAMVLMDAVVRLLPGVIGSRQSLASESHESGLLEYPHYTRPRSWRSRDIPEVLLSGNHERIEKWRAQQAVELTKTRRPDMWERYRQDHRDPKGQKDRKP